MYPFIFISVSLHLVSFLCIVLLFMRVSKGSELKEEVEFNMGQYIERLEEENDRLVEQVSALVEKRESQLDSRLKVLEQTIQVQEKPKKSTVIQHPSAKIERNQKAIQLHQQGFGFTDIAKLLNCGVGEVELILNMNGRSEQQ